MPKRRAGEFQEKKECSVVLMHNDCCFLSYLWSGMASIRVTQNLGTFIRHMANGISEARMLKEGVGRRAHGSMIMLFPDDHGNGWMTMVSDELSRWGFAEINPEEQFRFDLRMRISDFLTLTVYEAWAVPAHLFGKYAAISHVPVGYVVEGL